MIYKNIFALSLVAALFISYVECEEINSKDIPSSHVNKGDSLNLNNKTFYSYYDFTQIFSLKKLEELHIDHAKWGSNPFYWGYEDIRGYENLMRFLGKGNF